MAVRHSVARWEALERASHAVAQTTGPGDLMRYRYPGDTLVTRIQAPERWHQAYRGRHRVA